MKRTCGLPFLRLSGTPSTGTDNLNRRASPAPTAVIRPAHAGERGGDGIAGDAEHCRLCSSARSVHEPSCPGSADPKQRLSSRELLFLASAAWPPCVAVSEDALRRLGGRSPAALRRARNDGNRLWIRREIK